MRTSFGFFGAITTSLAILVTSWGCIGMASLVLWWPVVRIVVVPLIILARIVPTAVPMRRSVLVHVLWAGAVLLRTGVIIASSHGWFCCHVSTKPSLRWNMTKGSLIKQKKLTTLSRVL